MINSPKVIKDELFKTLVIKDIYEVISDSLIIVYSFIIIKNWTQKPREHYFYIYTIHYYRYIIYNYLFIYFNLFNLIIFHLINC